MTAVRLAGRACARYALPFLALSAIALAPIWWLLARTARGPIDVAHARTMVQVAWIAAGAATAFQLVVVAAVAPAVRALAGGTALTQWRALRAGAGNLVRGLVPIGLALAGVLIAGVGLVAPAALVLPLVALTGASERLGAPPSAAVADSIAIARRHLGVVVIAALALPLLDLGALAVLQRALTPILPAHPSPAELARFGALLRAAVIAFIVIAPLPAATLAAVAARDTGSGR